MCSVVIEFDLDPGWLIMMAGTVQLAIGNSVLLDHGTRTNKFVRGTRLEQFSWRSGTPCCSITMHGQTSLSVAPGGERSLQQVWAWHPELLSHTRNFLPVTTSNDQVLSTSFKYRTP